MNILIAGDFCPQHRVAKLFEEGDFSSVLGEVKSFTEQADFSIVNYECPVCNGNESPIQKQGPNLKSSKSGIEAIKWAGFDCVTLANNHFRDYGDEGCHNTLNELENHGIDYVGGGRNLMEASKTRYKTIGDKVLAIINCCENEFSIATHNKAGSNPLNLVQQFYAIGDAKQNADYVLVIVHGGHELYQLPSIRMQEIYRFFIDAGADAIVNHHQHCYSGYEVYKEKPILYGLGNFCFDKKEKKRDIWYEGYMVELEFGGNINFRILPYLQCKDTPTVKILAFYAFYDKIMQLNSIIGKVDALRNSQEQYFTTHVDWYLNILEPFINRPFIFLKRLGLVPSIISQKKLLTAINFVCCEAHRDIFMFSLNHYLQKNKKK